MKFVNNKKVEANQEISVNSNHKKEISTVRSLKKKVNFSFKVIYENRAKRDLKEIKAINSYLTNKTKKNRFKVRFCTKTDSNSHKEDFYIKNYKTIESSTQLNQHLLNENELSSSEINKNKCNTTVSTGSSISENDTSMLFNSNFSALMKDFNGNTGSITGTCNDDSLPVRKLKKLGMLNTGSGRLFNNGRWTNDEHKKFVEGILKFGNDWKKVQKHLKTRSSAQARSHAQKFFLKIKKYNIIRLDNNTNKIKSLYDVAKIMTEDDLTRLLVFLNNFNFEKHSNLEEAMVPSSEAKIEETISKETSNMKFDPILLEDFSLLETPKFELLDFESQFALKEQVKPRDFTFNNTKNTKNYDDFEANFSQTFVNWAEKEREADLYNFDKALTYQIDANYSMYHGGGSKEYDSICEEELDFFE